MNSRRVRRRCHSPSGTTRWRHSSFTDRTNRSACALQFGAPGGVRSTRTPAVESHCSTALLHFGSRSQTRILPLCRRASDSLLTDRRHWMTNASSGYGVEPRTCTRRDCNSIRNAVAYVTSPRVVHTSVVKKSAATSAGQCACTNVRHGVARCLPAECHARAAHVRSSSDPRGAQRSSTRPESVCSPTSDSRSPFERSGFGGVLADHYGSHATLCRSICERPVHDASGESCRG